MMKASFTWDSLMTAFEYQADNESVVCDINVFLQHAIFHFF